MANPQEVEGVVREQIVQVLSVEPEEVTPSARFFADLGGESIDLLDLSFRLEKKLGTKIQFDRMFSAEELPRDEQGRLTPEAAAAVHAKYPSLKVEHLKDRPVVAVIQEVLTVGLIADFVCRRLAETA